MRKKTSVVAPGPVVGCAEPVGTAVPGVVVPGGIGIRGAGVLVGARATRVGRTAAVGRTWGGRDGSKMMIDSGVGGSVGTPGMGVGGAGGAGGTGVAAGRLSPPPSSRGRSVGGGTAVGGRVVLVGVGPPGVAVGPPGVAVGPVGLGGGVAVGPVGLGVGELIGLPTTRTETVSELAPPALAELEMLVPEGVLVRTRTWIVTEAGLSARTVRPQLTVCPVVQLPELELALSTSRFPSTPSVIVTCWSAVLLVSTETL